jgi:hypothetical protein
MTMSASTFGVVEGFYGVYYTFPQRTDLIRFMASCGYNAYLYAPKNDRQHRTRWWEAYPPQIMQQFAALVEVARHASIDFAYGISPGGTICYASSSDFDRLTESCRRFMSSVSVHFRSCWMTPNLISSTQSIGRPIQPWRWRKLTWPTACTIG